MKNIIAGFIVLLALGSGSPALAQSTDRVGDIGGILTDALGGFLSGRQGADLQTWRGHFVQAKGTTMIFRAEDGKTYAVDMTAIGTQTWPFRTAHGTVERVEGSQLTVRTTDGGRLPVDVAQMTGEADFRARDGALVILEPELTNTVVWIEREDPRGAGEYRTLHGHRVYRSGTTMIFRAGDGRALAVDTSAVDAQVRDIMRPGDLVSVLGKTTARADQFVAELIEREARR